jgi:hypothetical protein
MNTIHRRPGSFDSMLIIPVPGGIYDGRKKQSDEELLFDFELLTIQQVATWAKVSTSCHRSAEICGLRACRS